VTVSESVRARVRQQAKDRCGYCQVSSQYVYAPMEIDHIIPIASGGTDDEENLWLTCPRCNSFKGTQTHGIDPETGRRVRLFNPRFQDWTAHFDWDDDGVHIIGQTACGRATVMALQLNYGPSVELRHLLVQAGWYPPD
jgi:hypothetical protein